MRCSLDRLSWFFRCAFGLSIACAVPLDPDDGVEPPSAETADDVVAYRVRLSAHGVIDPVRLRLTTASGHEEMTVSEDGSAQFSIELADGAGFSLDVVAGPARCALASPRGVVQKSDVTAVLVCSLIDDIALSGAGVPALHFTATQLEYWVDVSEIRDALSVRASSDRTDVLVSVDGRAVALGADSLPVTLIADAPADTEDTAIQVVARHAVSSASVTYVIHARRSLTIAQQTYAKASNAGADDNFGTHIAISRDGLTVVVGAPMEDGPSDGDANRGAVYVFYCQDGIWSEVAVLRPDSGAPYDQFGSAVALSADGGRLIASALLDDAGADSDQGAPWTGAVYVFEKSGNEWLEWARIEPSNIGAGDLFGVSLALSANGNTLAVGAAWEDSAATCIGGDGTDDSAQDSGAVYVFQRINGGWEEQAYLKGWNTDAGDQFGISVALSADGDTLAAGANGEDSAAKGTGGDPDSDGAPESGAVYVFRRAGRTWGQEAYIKALDSRAGAEFGISTALSESGDTLAVGAFWHATLVGGFPAQRSGAAYVFKRTGATWSEDARLRAPNAGELDEFGWSLALSASGHTLVVGARSESSAGGGQPDDDSAPGAGAAYVFHDSGTSWNAPSYVKASNAEAHDGFGYSVAVSGLGDVLAVAAIAEDSQATGTGNSANQGDNSAKDSGAVYIFH